MDSYLVKCCGCNSAFEALDRLNTVLSKYAKNRYQSNAFLLKKVFPRDKITQLIRYKYILENCTWNPDFYEPYFSAETIISRVKLLTNGL
jgi:hypothetical protein